MFQNHFQFVVGVCPHMECAWTVCPTHATHTNQTFGIVLKHDGFNVCPNLLAASGRKRHSLSEADITRLAESFRRGNMDAELRRTTVTGAAVVGPMWKEVVALLQVMG